MPKGVHSWFERISFEEAEKMFGERLDRRRVYYKHTKKGKTIDNMYAFNSKCGFENKGVFIYDEWREECSGCYGQGCHECGYHGKRVTGMHTPIDLTAPKLDT